MDNYAPIFSGSYPIYSVPLSRGSYSASILCPMLLFNLSHRHNAHPTVSNFGGSQFDHQLEERAVVLAILDPSSVGSFLVINSILSAAVAAGLLGSPLNHRTGTMQLHL